MEEFDVDFINLNLVISIMFQLSKTNEEITLTSLLKRLCLYFPEVGKDVEKIIQENTIEDITKIIRQTGDTKEHILFYDILNSDFGFKIIKIMKQNLQRDICKKNLKGTNGIGN